MDFLDDSRDTALDHPNQGGHGEFAASVPLLILLNLAACGGGGKPPDAGPQLTPFVHSVIDPKPPGGSECCTDVLAVGDLDGNGLPDLVIGGQGEERFGLVWYRAPTWERIDIGKGEFTTDGAVADLDGDRLPDIVTCDHGRGIFWYRNPGSSTRATWEAEKIGDGYAHDVAVGDLDGDRTIDVVTCDKETVTWWRRVETDWKSTVICSAPGEGLDIADLDADGNPDVCFSAGWLRNPGRGGSGVWQYTSVSQDWPRDTRVRAADVNRDGRPDLVLSASEGPGGISCFAAPPDPTRANWSEHPIIDSGLEGVHSLEVADLDLDGDLDLVAAEMHTSKRQRVMLCYQDGMDDWRVVILAESGSHNLSAADLGNDGDIDLIGKNYAGADRRLEIWENRIADARPWRYIAIDDDRPQDQFGKTGLCFGDFDHDGQTDVAAGSYAYLSPGGDLSGSWLTERLPDGMDAHFAVDVDSDAHADLIGFDATGLVWAERGENEWRSTHVAVLPEGRTQGGAAGPLVDGGRDEIVFTRGKRLLFVSLPSRPGETPWSVVQISDTNEEEGVDLGDIDGDGDLDVFAQDEDGHELVCYLNPGSDGRASWPRVTLGYSREWLDRLRVADIDGDGRLDVLTAEETQDWNFNANVFWFAPSARPLEEPWLGTSIARLRSVNSLDVGDVDQDGDVDIVVAEHTDQARSDGAADNITVLFLNAGDGRSWAVEWIDIGPRSSHLGARLHDLDKDGDLDVVSPAWQQYRRLHLWRNDRKR